MALLGLTALLAPMTMGSVCQPEPPPTRYTLRAFHPNETDAFNTITNGGWLNINEAYLCGDPGAQDCTGPQPVCSSNRDDQYQVNIHDGWQRSGHEYRRDRVAFFTSGSTVTPSFVRGDEPFIEDGWWRYWEGEGESSRIDPILEGPVRLVRRYERGLCSTLTENVAGQLRDEMQRTMRSTLRCARNKYYGCARAMRHTTPLGAAVWQYLGSDYCNVIHAANRDYYDLAFAFELVPKERLYKSSKIRLSLRLWFQLGAGPRSAYLDCPSTQTCDPDQCFTAKGCIREQWDYMSACAWHDIVGYECDDCFKVRPGCEDCKRSCSTRKCRQDADCCGLPGVVCQPTDSGQMKVTGVACNQEQGVCEKPHFLDVLDYGMEFHVEHLGACTYWKDYLCDKQADELSDTLTGMRNHAYRDIYAPLLQGMYDKSWTEWTTQCGSVEECWRDQDIAPDHGMETRCNENSYCDIRPMHIYGVNQYPNGLETVVAWDESAPAWGFFSIVKAFYCNILGPDDADYGWSDVQTFFPPDDQAPPVTNE